MFQGELFWMIIGALSVLMAISAPIWAKDLDLKMTWLRWILVVAWYLLLLLTVASPFTLIGENEAVAGFRIIPFLLVPTIILGVGLWRLLRLDPR
jgi:hypothetical protein